MLLQYLPCTQQPHQYVQRLGRVRDSRAGAYVRLCSCVSRRPRHESLCSLLLSALCFALHRTRMMWQKFPAHLNYNVEEWRQHKQKLETWTSEKWTDEFGPRLACVRRRYIEKPHGWCPSMLIRNGVIVTPHISKAGF